MAALPKVAGQHYASLENKGTGIKQHIPPGLAIDSYGGSAYVSLIAFTVCNLSPRLLPPLPFISNFHEVNLRTYVIRDGKPGIYFLSIEAEKLIPALLARFIMGLPYRKSLIKRKENYYFAKGNNTEMEVSYKKGRPCKNDPLDYWLTE
ncbi:MAG TPA: DUF2071 domain-containing protein, partial [Flavobacterium sp.]|nr:DUF2071 domain-containing protein [Flavobacterium sp.]